MLDQRFTRSAIFKTGPAAFNNPFLHSVGTV